MRLPFAFRSLLSVLVLALGVDALPVAAQPSAPRAAPAVTVIRAARLIIGDGTSWSRRRS